MNRDLVQLFIGKIVQVKIEGFAIYGKLCSFFDSEMSDTCILLLRSQDGFALMKGNFESLGEIER